MSDTPRTDEVIEDSSLVRDLCRTLERELAKANKKIHSLTAEKVANDAVMAGCFDALPECQTWGEVPFYIAELKEAVEAERKARDEAEQSYADCQATLKDERSRHSEHIQQLKNAASEEIKAANKRTEEAERNVKHYVSKYEMVMNALADSDGDATGVIIAFQKRAEQAEAALQNEKDENDTLRSQLVAAIEESRQVHEQLTAAQKDAERINWMEEVLLRQGMNDELTFWFYQNYVRIEDGNEKQIGKGIDVRAAIDAAREGK